MVDYYEIVDNTGVKPFIGAFDKTKTIHYTLPYNKITAKYYSERDGINYYVVNQGINFLWHMIRYHGYITLNDIYYAFCIGDVSFRSKDGDEWGILFDKDRDDGYMYGNFIHITTPGSDNDFLFFHGYEKGCEIKFDLVDVRQAKKFEEERKNA